MALKGHAGVLLSAAFSPDGTRIVTTSYNGTVRVWDAKTGVDISLLKARGGWLASFSGDGAWVITVGSDGTRVWDAHTGAEKRAWQLHEDRQRVFLASVPSSPTEHRVVTANVDGTVRVLDANTGAEVLVLKSVLKAVCGVAYSPDGSRIATAVIVETDVKDPVFQTTRYRTKIQMWDARTGTELRSFDLPVSSGSCSAFSGSLSFAPDGSRIAIILQVDLNSAVRIFDADTGAEVLVLDSPSNPINTAAFSPDGSRIAAGNIDGTVRVWDARTGAELMVLRGHSGVLNSVAFSPDGSRIVSGGDDTTVRVWDAQSGVELLTLKGHKWYVASASFSPDGNWIVTGSCDGTARLWGVRAAGLQPPPPALPNERLPPPRAAK